MADVAIRVDNLSKQYRIGVLQQRHDTLRDQVTDVAKKLARPGKKRDEQAENSIWALRDVSFEVRKGDVLGIIGANGAGKSTLLKILCRVTEPTEGCAEIRGRVGSLLEVGTGFHPELTGRENVYLNGAIIGMRHAEVTRKFDEIVSFAEVEKFIDTPVKRYSSGMYMRLAFAVAAHLETEILLIDEVLAVGDMAFQKKCLGKMGDVAMAGRTVLFVSHNLGAVQHLCGRSILLLSGRLESYGDPVEVVKQYQRTIGNSPGTSMIEKKSRFGSGDMRCVKIALLDETGNEAPYVFAEQPCCIELTFEAVKNISNVMAGIGIDSVDGTRLLTLYSEFTNQTFDIRQKSGKFRCHVPAFNLRPDVYFVSTFLGGPYGALDYVPNATSLEIRDSNYYNSGKLPDRSQGALLLHHSWSLL